MKNGYAAVALAALFLLPGICPAEELPGKTDALKNQDRVSYSIGYQIGGDLKKHGRTVDAAAFLQGMTDARKDAPVMDRGEMQEALIAFKKSLAADATDQSGVGQPGLPAQNVKAEQLFLEQNRQQEGVVTLASGLQYKIIKKGDGRMPKLEDTVTIHYKGNLIDGTEFYSTWRKGSPQTVPVSKSVPGLQEALQLMPEGSEWQLFIPHHLAYGEKGPLGDRTVIFELELLEIK
ncbi:MAG: FKBP-type peptidyl-prolyl cis-trans isomerase [Proteobacteria bacterium]|nr:FKBP-type peptidyl-prolyl cis-trans isomerase [Pseudomonadota bacterium]MBU1738873.1 FKBP-type peptidyl-prolyl cis-trans isomerase [Pseudomonadota bacterium]